VSADGRRRPAPDLREVATIWWDVDRDPEVVWDAEGRRFDLADPEDAGSRLRLCELASPAPDPTRVAAALADGLAACDFPPTAEGVPATVAARVLRAHGVAVRLAAE
jgi:hypothetical protein